MWAALGGLVSSFAGSGDSDSGSSGGGGGGMGYSGQNSSSISTPVTATAGGGIGAQRFDLANHYSRGVAPWMLIVGAAVLAYVLLRK